MNPPFDVALQLQRHGRALRALAGELVRDAAVADDAVQEVWAEALARGPRHDASLGGWLRTVLVHAVAKLRRSERRRAHHEDAAAVARREMVAEDHAVVLAREEQAERLLAAVRSLDAPHRDAIWQRYFEGKSPRAIAAASGVPVATVKSRLQRGLGMLRTRLGEEDGDGTRGDWRGAFVAAFGLGEGTAVATAAGGVLVATWTKVTMVAAAAVLAALVWWPHAELAPELAPRADSVSGAALAEAGARPAERTPAPEATRAASGAAVTSTTSAPVPAPTPGFVAGRAVDLATGSPLANVRVSLKTRVVGEVVDTVVTGADGNFELPARIDHRTGISLRRGDRVTVEWFGDVLPGEHAQVGDVAMRAGRTLPGRLVDPEGGAIPSDLLVVLEFEARFTRDWREVCGAARTDANGAFVVSEPLPLGAATLWSLPFGAVDLAKPVTITIGAEQPAAIELAVRQRPRIRGIVVDEAGQPVASGVRLGEQASFGDVAVAPDGTFTLLQTRPGATGNVFVVDAAAFEPAAPLRDVPWGTENVRIVLRRVQPFVLEVVDADGAPVEEFGVAMQRPGLSVLEGGAIRLRGVHAGGRVEVLGVVRGQTALRVFAVGSQWAPSEPTPSGNGDSLRIVLARRSPLDIVVRRSDAAVADALVELVWDPEARLPLWAKPLPGVDVVEHVLPSNGYELESGGRTDREGRVRVWRGRDLAGCVVRVLETGGPPYVQRALVAPASGEALRIELPATGELRARAELRGCRCDDVRLEIPGTEYVGDHALVARRDGTFASVVLARGAHEVRLGRRLARWHTFAVRTVDIAAAPCEVAFDLAEYSLGGVRGVVSGAGALPPLAVDLLLGDVATGLRVVASAAVAADGTFACDDLLPGSYHVALRRGGGGPGATPAIGGEEFVVAGGEVARVGVRYAPRRLVVRLVWPDGKPVRGERVLTRCAATTWPEIRILTPMVEDLLVLDPAPALPLEFREWSERSPWSAAIVMPTDRAEAEITVVLPR